MDIIADPELRLRGLVVLFATVAGLRLILAGLRRPRQRWSLLVGGLLVVVSLARALPRFL